MTTKSEFKPRLLNTLKPYIREWGIDHRRPWKLESRKLLDYLLVYVAEGNGLFDLNGNSWVIESGDLFWVPPDTLHTMEGYAPFMVCVYVHFDLIYRPKLSHWKIHIPSYTTDLELWQEYKHPSLDIPCITNLAGRIRSTSNNRIGMLLKAICHESSRSQPYTELNTSGLMMEILAKLLRSNILAERVSPMLFNRMEKAVDYIDLNCHRNLKIEEIATFVNLSPSHFRLQFGNYFSCSPREYLRSCRIRHAKELMANESLSLTEIAHQVGYDTVHSFSRAFRKTKGLCPKEYRKCKLIFD